MEVATLAAGEVGPKVLLVAVALVSLPSLKEERCMMVTLKQELRTKVCGKVMLILMLPELQSYSKAISRLQTKVSKKLRWLQDLM